MLTNFDMEVVFFCKKTWKSLAYIINYDFICPIMFALIKRCFYKCVTK